HGAVDDESLRERAAVVRAGRADRPDLWAMSPEDRRLSERVAEQDAAVRDLVDLYAALKVGTGQLDIVLAHARTIAPRAKFSKRAFTRPSSAKASRRGADQEEEDTHLSPRPIRCMRAGSNRRRGRRRFRCSNPLRQDTNRTNDPSCSRRSSCEGSS